MSPYRILGLEESATETEIKRAYARSLKQHRPDDDPAGFQRVHEAYTHCLADARYRTEYGDYDEHGHDEEEDTVLAVTEMAEQAGAATLVFSPRITTTAFASETPYEDVAHDEDDYDNTTPADPGFDVDGFVEELLSRMRESRPLALSNWLHAQEPLYSLELKQSLCTPVAYALANAEPVPAADRLQVVLAFFGLDGVGHPHGWLHNVIGHALLRVEASQRFDRIVAQHQSPATKPIDRMLMRELIEPRNWWRWLFILLFPFLPSRTGNLLQVLEEQGGETAKARLNHTAAEFWRRAADRERLDWRRVLVALLRVPLILPLAVYYGFVIEKPISPATAANVCGIATAAWFVIALIQIGAKKISRLNERSLQLDIPLVVAAIALSKALILAQLSPGWSIGLSCVTLMIWLQPRSWGLYYAGCGVATLGAIAVILGVIPLGLATEWTALPFVLGACYGAACVVAHDALYARVKQLSMAQARRSTGWLGWLALVNFALMIAAPLVALALKQLVS